MRNMLSPTERIERSSEYVTESGCRIWTGNLNAYGYGRFKKDKVTYFAHRVAWQSERGEIPSGMLVCHKCDVPMCCNVDHLFLGTDKDNSDDKIRKGRSVRGERQKYAKLTDDLVRRIRSDNRTNLAIAAELGISDNTISGVRSWKSWKHVPMVPQ